VTLEVEPRFKPDPVACPCGCGLVGFPRARAWQDGLAPHVKRCACRRCAGGRTGKNARRREHKIARETGGTREPLSGALSGVDVRSGMWVIEETANVALLAGLRRWWNSKGVRMKLVRLFGRSHAGEYRAFIASWDGKPRVVVIPYEDFAQARRDGAL
jgi:hypothetical protein